MIHSDKKQVFFMEKLVEHMEYYNEMSPFPVYGTEKVLRVKNKLEQMKLDKKVDYDNLPVHFCQHCKSLHIEVDTDSGNDICGRCGAVNEVDVLPNIKAYSDKYRNIWD